MTASPLPVTAAANGHLDCRYFAAGACRSCALLETPYPQQVSAKESWCREVLADHAPGSWLPAATGGAEGFRNRAKLAVGGARGALTLGILDQEFHGVDLRDCGIQEPAIRAVIPVLAEFLDATGLDPYDVPRRRGELKFVHVTAAPSGELMIRFVVRTQFGLEVLASRRERLLGLVPHASVVSVNLLPEHKAALEGSREVLLHGDSLRMGLGRVDLHLRPQSFFQTNTTVAIALYDQVAVWVDEIAPSTLWDLYCGVGGFALHCAGGAGSMGAAAGGGSAGSFGAVDSFAAVDSSAPADSFGVAEGPATGPAPQRRVTGVEVSEQAIESAKLSAAELGADVRFIAADATEFAETTLGRVSRPADTSAAIADPTSTSATADPLAPTPDVEVPDCVIVNPPRRGIGARLAQILENSGVEHVVYSSCNPQSLARDLDRMPSFAVEQARVFDMFPHTKHLEAAVLLRRRSAGG